jgi:hypothetical protein
MLQNDVLLCKRKAKEKSEVMEQEDSAAQAERLLLQQFNLIYGYFRSTATQVTILVQFQNSLCKDDDTR